MNSAQGKGEGSFAWVGQLLSDMRRSNAGMPTVQPLLFPDPQPLVEKFGCEFFRQLPQVPGVYLMHDESDRVLYVGKAKNLRNRLRSYRVANPDRLPRRLLRLLHQVHRIELIECGSEASALKREAKLLRALKPKFNRAGVWPGSRRFLAWRVHGCALDLMVTDTPEDGWSRKGPLGVRAFSLRTALLRLLWCAIHTDEGLVGMPHGWFHTSRADCISIRENQMSGAQMSDAKGALDSLIGEDPSLFTEWLKIRVPSDDHLFQRAVMEKDLETVNDAFAVNSNQRTQAQTQYLLPG